MFDVVQEHHLKEVLSSKWDSICSQFHEELMQSWETSNVPAPARWPRYQLSRVRFLEYLFKRIVRRRNYEGSGNAGFVRAETWLESDGGRLVGRVDLVEVSNRGVELIDFKSNVADENYEDGIRPEYRTQLMIYAYLWHAVNGEWPNLLSIQAIDGNRLSFQASSEECTDAGLSALKSLEVLNVLLEGNVPVEQLASPNADSCRYCPYRGGCTPFLEAVNNEWEWYKKSFTGVIQKTYGEGATVHLDLENIRGNLETDINSVRVLGVPSSLGLKEGYKISIVDAMPTQTVSNISVAWDTQIWTWA